MKALAEMKPRELKVISWFLAHDIQQTSRELESLRELRGKVEQQYRQGKLEQGTEETCANLKK